MERSKEFIASLDIKIDNTFEKCKQDISMITANLRGIEKKVQGNEEDTHSLRNTIDQLERKNSLRINGLPENDRENIPDVILKFIRNTLEVACKSEDVTDVFTS
ncbi:hypothetical protein JTB14_030356 [Gonioctena quinquepunctata]|nr:hypothetical protein JTB14_030356 [Gonioctena quinquepunctata]